ncbi:hypothetical protein GCM10027435_18830 [Haloparvum alkalitolerans]|uniref:hypothetical protein n=1 Tax=Haloparvum alkalitolerans TaxID=1042953 RepID=UPI003CF205C1
MIRRLLSAVLGAIVVLPPVVLDPWNYGYVWVAVGGAVVGLAVAQSWWQWELRTPAVLAALWLALVYWHVLTWQPPESGLGAGAFPPQRTLVYAWPGLLFVGGLVAVMERNLRLMNRNE